MLHHNFATHWFRTLVMPLSRLRAQLPLSAFKNDRMAILFSWHMPLWILKRMITLESKGEAVAFTNAFYQKFMLCASLCPGSWAPAAKFVSARYIVAATITIELL